MSIEKDPFGIEKILKENNPRNYEVGDGARWTKDNVYYQIDNIDTENKEAIIWIPGKEESKKKVSIFELDKILNKK